MCGIIGVTGREGVSQLLLEGLRTLEYRGYDSAGVAIQRDGGLTVLRRAGKLGELAAVLAESPPFGHAGLGHTRWATHGPPTERNAHPIVDASDTLAVVHNGIIENFEELKAELESEGIVFRTDTDTEVIANLLARDLRGGLGLAAALRATAARLQGSYSIGALSTADPELIVGIRRHSPLVVGIADGATFLASDMPALLAHTRRMIPLEDGDVVELRPGGVLISDMQGQPVVRPERRIDWDPVTVQKGGYRHFMLKEIDEQPAAVSATMISRLDDATGSIHMDALDALGERLAQVERMTFVACGTSWHAGLAGKFYIENLVGIPVDVDYASEFRYRNTSCGPDHLIVPITQSGETLDTLAAMRDAKAQGAPIISVVNVPESSAMRESDATILTVAGPEIGVASTKAFTTQLVALYMLALDLAVRRGSMSHAEVAERIVPLRRVRYAMEGALRQADKVAEVAHRFSGARDFLFLGRGVNYPIALEGALKLKEISYIQEVRSRDGVVIAVCAEGDERVKALADEVLEVPAVDEDLSPLVNVVPLQLLAYHVAERLGKDVDQPRNLAKSVTVE